MHPESIDDSALNARLAPYATTRLNPKQLALAFPSDGVIRQIMMGKRMMPTEPELKLVYSVNVARLEQQDANQAQTAANAPPNANDGSAPKPSPAEEQARAIADSLLALPKNQRLAALENTPPEQLVNFPNLVRGDQRDRLVADFTPQEREIFRAFANPAGVVASELQQAKVVRAIYSERQLLEVMTDFWFNHFNVFQFKNQDAYYTTAYERDVIRPHALGKFYDLLVATAQSPAMLMYLDNWLSIGPHSDAAGKNGQSGLNENYGREVMELHTLGVDGGYTQADVTELARVLTGWTIVQPDDGGQFQFDPHRHEPGSKIVLGEKFYDTGNDEGVARPGHAGASSFHGAFHLQVHRSAIRFRRSARKPGRPHGREVPVERRRYPRSPPHHDSLAGVLVAGRVPRQIEDAAGIRRFRGAGQRRERCGAGRAGAKPDGHGHAAVRHGPSHGLFHESGHLGKHGRAAGAHQFFLGADPGKARRRAIRSRGPAGAGDSHELRSIRDESGSRRGTLGPRFRNCAHRRLHSGWRLSPRPMQQSFARKWTDPDVRKQTEASPVDVLRFAAGFVLASPEFQRH